MGNKESQQKKQLQIYINHPRFNKSKIVTKDNRKYLQTSQGIDQKEYNNWKYGLTKYHEKANTEYLMLPSYHSFDRVGLCGNAGTVLINYQNYPYLLTQEIYNRKGKKSRFQESQLWLLLFCLSEGRKQAHAAGQTLGDVRPANIFLNQNSQIKVSNSLSWPLQMSNYQKSIDKIQTYLAPEDLNRLQRGETVEGSTDLSEAFSIGLTVLSAANLADYSSIYDFKVQQIIVPSFNEAQAFLAFNNSYSIVLRGSILLLTKLISGQRFGCEELSQLLFKHRDSILKKEIFVVDNAPVKLHQQIQRLQATLMSQVTGLNGANN